MDKPCLGWYLLLGILICGASVAGRVSPVNADTIIQQIAVDTPSPTVSVGVTVATVNAGDNPDINVRSGPSTDYPIIGKLLAGQQVPALGKSPGGDWVQISYPQGLGGVGWVYAYLVTLSGIVPVVEPPPTPTPLVTPTIDPSLAAQFIADTPAVHLPTFTAPPPLAIATFPAASPLQLAGGKPLLYIMFFLAGVGLVGVFLSFLRVRY